MAAEAGTHAGILAIGNLGQVAAVPWKNEGGQTRELWVEPPQADFTDFVWRASVADVGRDGDFSTFDGIDRTIVLLEGGGFTMLTDGVAIHDLRESFAPFPFAGETRIAVSLHGAPTLDFNLMIRRSEAEGGIAVLNEQNSYRLPASTVLLYVAQGGAFLSDGTGMQQHLRVGEFVRFREGAGLPNLLCAAGAVVLAIHVRRRS